MNIEEKRKVKREYMTLWRSKNRERYNAWAKEYHHKRKHLWESKTRGYRLKSVYHITEEDFQNMTDSQNGVCKICGCSPNEHGKNKMSKVLHIDHDHATGKIRGLLCSRCNGALGWYEKCKDGIKSYLN